MATFAFAGESTATLPKSPSSAESMDKNDEDSLTTFFSPNVH